MEKIKGKINAILYPKNGKPDPATGFAIIRVCGSRNDFSAKGSMPDARVGMEAEFTGDWKSDKYGQTFVVSSMVEIEPSTEDGIRNYLSSGLIRGIGPVLAEKIVAKFGKNTLEVLNSCPERLFEVDGIGKKKAQSLVISWNEQKVIRDVMIFLKQYGVGNAVAVKIYKKYGKDSIGVLKANPYQIADEIDGVGFLTADKIALSMGLPADSHSRICSAALYAANDAAVKGGHVYLPIDELCKATLSLLNAADAESIDNETVKDCIRAMISSKKFVCENYGDEDAVYLPSFHYAEKNVAKRLKALAGKVYNFPINTDILENYCGLHLASEQYDAIMTAVNNGVSIITGGPGTGKTTTVKGIIKYITSIGFRVVLAAPTGRAAKRLTETTGMEAKTIHRLLEFVPSEGFTRNEENPLEGGMLIVDESSMIDIHLMSHLLNAIPSEMSVVFVGDIDQLPSVGAGNVLRDMITSGIIPTARLTHIFRQAQDSLIVWNAHRINRGEAPSLPCDLTPSGQNFAFVECSEPEKIVEHVKTLVGQYIPDHYGFGTSDIQVLSPMRKGPIGTESLNSVLQQTLNPDGEGIKRGFTEYRVGDKVMQITNNYEIGVFNGDVGSIIDIDKEEYMVTVDFDGNVVKYSNLYLDQLVLAYACTIHKSQGSEYPVVVMVVSMAHYVMLMRNLLYTGITRAKKLCVVIGEKKAIATMIGNNTVRKRWSHLCERLSA